MDGKVIKEEIFNEYREKVSKLDRKPKLAVIYTKDNDGIEVYLKSKKKMCEYVGYDYIDIDCRKMNTIEIVEVIDGLNKDKSIDGIFVMFPLREKIEEDTIINSISKNKDIDGLRGDSKFMPCTSSAIMRMLKYYKIELEDKRVLIIGRSKLITRKLIDMLMKENSNVCIIHSRTSDMDFYIKNSDIIISGVGKYNLINKSNSIDGKIIIDAGISYKDGMVVGDVGEVGDRALVSKVPGGVGQVTSGILCENIFLAYLENNLNNN